MLTTVAVTDDPDTVRLALAGSFVQIFVNNDSTTPTQTVSRDNFTALEFEGGDSSFGNSDDQVSIDLPGVTFTYDDADSGNVALDLVKGSIHFSTPAQLDSLTVEANAAAVVQADADVTTTVTEIAGSYTQSGGSFIATSAFDAATVAGETASVNVSGGTLSAGAAFFGYGGQATVTQSGGTMSFSTTQIGSQSSLTSSVNQTGGTFSSTDFWMGYFGHASYHLGAGATLSCAGEHFGTEGYSTFTNDGGSNDGLAGAAGWEAGAHDGHAVYTQTAGSTTGGGVMGWWDGDSIVNLSGGSFTCNGFNALGGWSDGNTGSGTFNQSGGTVHIFQLALGYTGGTGTYNLSAGNLWTGFVNIGLDQGTAAGQGTFTQTGGHHYINWQSNGPSASSVPEVYNLDGGSLHGLIMPSDTLQFNFTHGIWTDGLIDNLSGFSDQSSETGAGVTVRGTFSNSDWEPHYESSTIDWGDGTTQSLNVTRTDTGGWVVAGHEYAQSGLYHVLLHVADPFRYWQGGDAETVFDVNVASSSVPDGDTLKETVNVPVADVYSGENYFETGSNGHSYVRVSGLTPGMHYLLRATGLANIEDADQNVFADAEYRVDANGGIFDSDPSIGLDLGVSVHDITIGQGQVTKGGYWGAYEADHVYTQNITAQYSSELLKFFDTEFVNNEPYSAADPTSYIKIQVYEVPNPVELSAAADNSHRRIDLGWNSVPNAASYKLFGGTALDDLQQITLPHPDDTSYYDYNVTSGVTSYYAVEALDSSGQEIAESDIENATLSTATISIDGSPDTSYSATLATQPSSTVYLTATIRDFQPSTAANPTDFQQAGLTGHQRTEVGEVEKTLGPNGTPVLDPTVFHPGDGGIHSLSSFNQWFQDVSTLDASGQPVNKSAQIELPFTLSSDGGTPLYILNSDSFLPINGRLFGDQVDGVQHQNGNFTMAVHTSFTYHANESNPPKFNFDGNDDTWVFINNHLVIDEGSIHQSAPESVTLNAAEATKLGLVDGQTYPFDFFYAERDMPVSQFYATTSIPMFKGNSYSASLTASEPDFFEDEGDGTQPLTWHVISPSNATITSSWTYGQTVTNTDPISQAVLNWVPTAADIGTTKHFDVEVTDALGNSATKEWDVVVSSTADRAPQPVSPAPTPPSSVAVGQAYT